MPENGHLLIAPQAYGAPTPPRGGERGIEMSDNTATSTTTNAGTTVENTGENTQAERTFTQDEVNSLIAKERRATEAKFSNYEDFKAKAAKLDELEEASKSELEKANDALAKATAELETMKAEKQRAETVAQVAKETGVPVDVVGTLNGETAEQLAEQAEAIANAYKTAQGAPSIPEAGSFARDASGAKTTAQMFADAISGAGF